MAWDSQKEKILLEDLIDIEKWQKIQDHFADVIGITIRTVDLEGRLLTKPSKPTRFCHDIVAISKVGSEKCGNSCMPNSISGLQQHEKYFRFVCHLGLCNLLIPILATGDILIAHILVGPIMAGKRLEIDECRKIADKLGIDIEEFMDGLREIKLFSFGGIESIGELLQDVTHCLVQSGYQRIKLEKLIPDLRRADKVFYNFYLDKLFNVLLDVTSTATGAESGSVMIFDNVDSGMLTIKVAKGIEENIIKNTKLKLGDGIAGIVAEDRKPRLISDTVDDMQIKNRLNRPHIKSAIVVPLQTESGELLGVINVNTHNPEKLFTQRNVEQVCQLVKLATVAIAALSVK